MRKIFLSLIALNFFFVSKAQITKTYWIVGGSGGFNLIKTMDVKVHYLQLSPNVGYFFLTKFAIGLKPSYTHEKTVSSGSSFMGKNTDFFIGPFTRYYFLNAEKPFNILLEGNYQHGFSKSGNQYSTTKTNSNRFSFLVGPVIYFNTAVGLEFLGGYEQLNYSSSNPNQREIIISIGLQFHLQNE